MATGHQRAFYPVLNMTLPALHPPAPRWPVALLVAAPAALALILYWPTLSLPILYDDLLHIRIAGNLNWANVWLPTRDFGFYRPFTFIPFLILRTLFGHYPAPVLHGLNLLQHAANAALLTGLSWRLGQGRARALASGLLFAVFPFSYQAVAVYGHNVHPAIVGLMLTGLHTYLSALRSTTPRRWWAATVLIFIISLLTHETAVLFGLFVLGLTWAERGSWPALWPRTTANSSRAFAAEAWLVFAVMGALYTLGYRLLPISRQPQATASLTDHLWLKALYVLQAAAYPFTWFAHWLRWMDATTLILGSVGLTLALTLWAARQRARWPLLMLGWGWWALASALIGANLSADYLLHGPRLLYLSAVGLAFVWPMLLEAALSIPKIGRAAWGAALLFILAANVRFISARLNDYARLTRPVAVAASAMAARPTDAGVLFVNLPQWLSPPSNTYALGAEFVSMLGDYLFVGELVAQNIGPAHPARALEISDLLTPANYTYGIQRPSPLEDPQMDTAAREWDVFITHYAPDQPETEHTGWISPAANATLPLAFIGPYTLLSANAAHCAGRTAITLTWQELAFDAPLTASLFVHALDEAGQLLGQADGPPLGVPPGFIHFGPNQPVTEQRQIASEPPTVIHLGLYDFVNGMRFPALDSNRAPLPDSAFALPVQPCP